LLDFLSEEDLWDSEEGLWDSEEDLCDSEEDLCDDEVEERPSFLDDSDFDFLGLFSFLFLTSGSSLMSGGGGVDPLDEDLGLVDFLVVFSSGDFSSLDVPDLWATRSLARRRGSRLTRLSSSFLTEHLVSTFFVEEVDDVIVEALIGFAVGGTVVPVFIWPRASAI